MRNKKVFILIFSVFVISQFLYSADLSIKKIETEDFRKNYPLCVDIINKELSQKLDISINEVKVENTSDIFELSYLMYCPIVLIFYLHTKSIFEIEQYVCICMTDENKNLISIDIKECDARNFNEIFILQK